MLHDRDELFALVEQLVGLELDDDRRPHNVHKGTPPVIVAAGRRGSGKTAPLERIFTAYESRVPQARLDLAGERYAEAGGHRPDSGLPLLRWRAEWTGSRAGPGSRPGWDTPLLRLLRDVKWDLEQQVHDNGRRLRFPRLDIAQLAIASWDRDWQRDTDITLADARKQLNAAREAVTGKDAAEHDDVAVGWITDVLSGFSGNLVEHPADIFIQATVSAFLQRTLPPLRRVLSGFAKGRHGRGSDVPVRWHGQFGSQQPKDGYDSLVTVARDWSDPGRRRRHEERLVAAFLADLRAEYTGGAGWNRAVRPLVLLDNADASPAGRRLVSLAHDDRAKTAGEVDPLVIVAAGPGAFDLAGQPSGQPPRHLTLAPLGEDAVARELGRADSWRLPSDLPRLIQRLTGGLPAGVAVLTQAVTGAAPDTGAAQTASGTAGGTGAGKTGAGNAAAGLLPAAGLLDLPSAPGDDGESGATGESRGPRARRGDGPARSSVTSLLLKHLITDDTWRSRLALLSCARDDAEARILTGLLVPAARVRFVVSDAEELLDDNDWLAPGPPAGRERCRCGPPGSGFFVGDAFLRTLLRHELGVTGRPVSAAKAHTALRDRYGGPGAGLLSSTEPSRLYHCLALGEAGHVAGRLHAAFEGSDAQSWLAALVHAAAAPYPHPGTGSSAGPGPDGDDPRRRVAFGGDADEPDADLTYLSVNRLLHAAWYLHDPLVSPEGAADEVIDTLADELRSLARSHPRGYGVLFHASRAWPRRLRAWDQSYCPTTEGE